MKTLLDLQISIGATVARFSSYRKFVALAQREGMEIKPLHLNTVDDPGNLARVLSQVERAHGFWIRSPVQLADARVRQAVEERIRAGAIAIAHLSSSAQPGSDWFQGLGIEATSIRAVCSESLAHLKSLPPMAIAVERETYDYGFRDPSLFRAVRSLVVQQANGIGCFGESQVVLALPSTSILLVDSRTDYFVSSVPRPELPVIATSSREDWRGRVIALHAGIFHDPYSGPLGTEFPGIEAADNERFAQNLLQVVAAGARTVGNGWENAYLLINDIETAVARLTDKVLVALAGPEWFRSCVPERIRDKCQTRQELEKAGFPPAAYLELIDYKTIWKDNWGAFEPLFSKAAPPASKTRSLHFFQEINPIRILAAHPTKRLASGLEVPTAEQLALLNRTRALLKMLG